MNIGKLRNRIIVENATQTNTSADTWGRTDTFTQAGETVWADVELLRGEKRYMDNSMRLFVNYKITMRHNEFVKVGSRIKWGSRFLVVNDISGDPVTDEMVAMCYEQAAN